MTGDRTLRFQGADNFRDLGGYPVRSGGHVRRRRLYRSGSLHELSPADVSFLGDELRIGLVVDLRSDWELDGAGRGALHEQGITILHSPVRVAAARREEAQDALRGGDLARYYGLLLRDSAEAIADIVANLAATQAAAVIHCAAGKDRTGVVAAVLLSALGVPDEHIVEDYALTERYRADVVRRLQRTGAYDAMLSELPAAVHRAEPATMRAVLQRLHAHYGSAPGYLEAAGLPRGTLDDLRRNLVSIGEDDREGS